MSDSSSIYLIGPMGAGKSAVGRHLARLLKREFFDSDAEIEQRTGVDIPFIFEKEGEAGFRRRERQMLDELCDEQGIVLATGGGVVMDEANRRRLVASGVVFYLHASVDQQLARTRLSRNRPLLETDDPRARLEEIMAVRDPLYRSMADYVVDTNGRRVGQVAEEIRSWLGKKDNQ